jgi:hypothetical protein
MKKMVLCLTLLVFLFASGVCFAKESMPNLIGTWAVKSEAALLTKGGPPGDWTHHRDALSNLTAEIVITKQEGRVFYATFTSKLATENMAGVIGWDNKTLYLVDMDGFTDATIVSPDKITCIYRHVGDKDAVVAAGVWTRVKN